jgi:glutaredoxin
VTRGPALRQIDTMRAARPFPSTALPLAVLALLLQAGPAWAQYKVVGPDGRITYTDRPVVTPGTKVQTIGPRATLVVPGQAPLPAELRGVAARFPVTLYTGGDCAPCDSARQLLRQRGIPYAERSITSDDDAAALQRLSNGRTLPTLAVGQQVLRGWGESDWTQTLDLAGYPKESRLPRDWAPPPVTPLVARAAEGDDLPTVQGRPGARPVAPTPIAVLPDVPASGPNIRF